MKKSFFSRAVNTAIAAVVTASCVPLNVFAFDNDTAQEISTTISFDEFASAMSDMGQKYNPQGFFGKVELTCDGKVFVDGQQTSKYNLENSIVEDGEFMADAEVFEIFDENADVQVDENGVRIFTENGEVELSKDECALRNTQLVPVEQVAVELGYEVSRDGNSLTLSNPFESARLIVKSNGAIDKLNAIDVVCGYMNLNILQFETPHDAYQAYLTYSTSDNVEFAVPSQARTIDAAETQSMSGLETTEHYSWGAQTMAVDGFNSMLSELSKDEEEIIVAVLDSGIDLDHEAFSGRITDSGVNFSTSNETYAEDDQGHGTHVAGIICDLTLDNVKIMPVKVLNTAGTGYDDMIFTGIIYAIESGADVINMSLGGFGHGDIYKEAFEYAEEKGVVVCVASGNDGIDAYRTVPASCENVITVGAIDEDLSLGYYSNFGETIEFVAPGTAVLSTYLDNQYAYLTGTSMAAPHASAAAAMLKSYDKSLNSEQIKNILADSAIDLGEKGKDEYFGYGAICFDGIEIFDEKCPAIEADVLGDSYENAVSVQLGCAYADAQIYYTLDSSEPSEDNGELYTGAIEISQTAVLKAVAVCNGKYNSDIFSQKYIIGSNDSQNCYTVENGVITSYSGLLEDVVIPRSYDSQTITAIGANAFSENESIKSVTIPEGVVSIGENAFYGCVNLTSVNAADVAEIGVGAFENCKALVEINAEKVLTIGENAFRECIMLEYVDFPLAQTVGEYAFEGCETLTTADIPCVVSLGSYAFSECAELSDCRADYENMTAIGDYAFYMCSALENEIVCTSLETIGQYSFYGCRNIECVVLSDNITEIPVGAFAGCRGLYYLGANNVTSLAEESLCHAGEVFTDMDIALLIVEETSLEGTELSPYKIGNAMTQSVALNELYVASDNASLEFTAPESKTYYIEINGAVAPSITGIEAQFTAKSGNTYICGIELAADAEYPILVDSKSNAPFSVKILEEVNDERQDISDFTVVYENGTPIVRSDAVTLTEGVDFEAEITDNSVTIFATGRYKGSIRIYPSVEETVYCGQTVDLNSLYGEDEFVFVPEISQTYYFYALYSEEDFVKSVENGTKITIEGRILGEDRELLYTSKTCLQPDCYSYTYFYIEAYLEAGQTYYLQSDTGNKTGEYSIRITDTIRLMFDTMITMPTTQVITGGEIIPEIAVEDLNDYTQLVCGEDYLVHVSNNVKPGNADVYVYGLGDYFGVANRQFTIVVEEYEATTLTLGSEKSFDIAADGYATASINIDAEGSYRITFTSDVEVKSYMKHISSGLSSENKKSTFTTSMREGEYVIMFYPQDFAAATVSIKIEQLYNISDASVYVEDLEYVAGVCQIPQVTVRYGFTKLTEGVDYELSFVGNSPLPGVHYFGIKGLGKYTGSATGTYTVGCSIKTSTAKAISEGEHIVDITTAGSYKLFKFTATEDTNYLLSTRENANVALVVFDRYGNTVSASSSPMGFGAEFTMSAGDVMYIAAMYYDGGKTGSWTFEMTSDYVLFEDVEAVFDENVSFNGSRTIPEITFVDGDYTLVQGVDYEYFYVSNCTNYGTASICYRGLGKYKFNKHIEYNIVMPIDELYATAVPLKESAATLYEGDFYSCGVYSFTATENAYYNLSQISAIDMAFVQFYDENGKLLKKRSMSGGSDVSTRFFLKENETMYMLTGYLNCENFDIYSGYLVRASVQSKIRNYDYEEDGVTYTVFPSLSYAVVSDVHSSVTDVTLLDTVDTYPVTQINSQAFEKCENLERLIIPEGVTEIGAFAFEGLNAPKVFLPKTTEIIGYRAFGNANIIKLCVLSSDTELIVNSIHAPNIVYGYENTTAQEYCKENGVEYRIISSVTGDMNGDGIVDSIDATIAVRCSVGRIAADPDMNGDVNGDGVLDAIDATMITRYTVGRLDKFPV